MGIVELGLMENVKKFDFYLSNLCDIWYLCYSTSMQIPPEHTQKLAKLL